MRNHGFFYLVASVAIAIATAGGAAAQSTVKVGMVMPLTGTLADAGKQVVAGARLYMAEHGVTVAGKRVELIVKDDASSYETGKRLIQEAIVNDKVNIIAGGTSGDLFAAAPVITAAKVPTVIMISSTSAVIAKSPYYVRTSTTIAQSSTIMADWSIRNGIKKVVTLVSDFAPGLEAETTSIHRGQLQFALLKAVRERLGEHGFLGGLRLRSFEQDAGGVAATFRDSGSGANIVDRGDVLVGADGIHSTVRRQLYPDEGEPRFAGQLLWRAAIDAEPFLDGKTMIVAGHFDQRIIAYPMGCSAGPGELLTNWVCQMTVSDSAPQRED